MKFFFQCENPNMEPTLSQIKCQRSTGKSKKGKFIPRRARVNCVVKKNSKAMRSMGSTAEETCGYLPVQIAQPASYFCEDMSCHFYCPDNLTVRTASRNTVIKTHSAKSCKNHLQSLEAILVAKTIQRFL